MYEVQLRCLLQQLEQRCLLAPLAVGDEFRISTESVAGYVQAAADSDGNFAIAWTGYQPGTGYAKTFIRRYSADGQALGEEFLANPAGGHEYRPAIAMHRDGGFVVAWERELLLNSDGTFERDAIQARRFDSSGVALGEPLHVNQTTPLRQTRPSVAMDLDGNFVVTWESEGQLGGDISEVMARRFSASGQPLGDEFIANQTTFYRQQDADVIMDSKGGFTLAWVSYSGTGSGGVVLRQFNNDGSAGTDEIVVTSSGAIFGPRMARLASGGLVITYVTQIDESPVIAGRVYGADLSPLGSEFPISAAGAHDVAAKGDGFVTTWDWRPDIDTPADIYAREFDGKGVAISEQSRVNSTTTHNDTVPVVTSNPDGDYVVAWLRGGATPDDPRSVSAQRFAHPPVAQQGNFAHDAPVPQLRFTFSENVIASLSMSDLQLLDLATGQTIDSAAVSLSWDPVSFTATFTFRGLPRGVLPDARYRATLDASDITDPAGNAMQQDAVLEFFVLAGDATRDAKVDQLDLQVLVSNWQQSPRTFSQGDFNYSGMVDITDLGMLATNWQTNLPVLAAARRPSKVSRVASDVLLPGGHGVI